jgi:trehalose-phosphatase
MRGARHIFPSLPLSPTMSRADADDANPASIPLPSTPLPTLPHALDKDRGVLAEFLLLRAAPAQPLPRLRLLIDYDGTLANIVADPEAAQMTPQMKDVLHAVVERLPTVAVVTGRCACVLGCSSSSSGHVSHSNLSPPPPGAPPHAPPPPRSPRPSRSSLGRIVRFVDVPPTKLTYAASHGYDVAGPNGLRLRPFAGYIPHLQEAAEAMRGAANAVHAGVTVEDNVFSVSVHYRNCPLSAHAEVEGVVKKWTAAWNAAAAATAAGREETGDRLEVRPGKMVWEIRPAVAWSKGHAAKEVLRAWDEAEAAVAEAARPAVVPGVARPTLVLVVGDDHTDEDMFRAALEVAAGQPGVVAAPVLVTGEAEGVAGEGDTGGEGAKEGRGRARMPRHTAARFYLRSPEEVRELLEEVHRLLVEGRLA